MKKNNKGFSLVELIVVIAIMAILAAVAVVGVSVYIPKAQQANDKQLAADIEYAFEMNAYNHPNGAVDFVIITTDGAQAKVGGFADEALTDMYGSNWRNELKLHYKEWSSSNSMLTAALNATSISGSSYLQNSTVTDLLGNVQDVTSAAADLLGSYAISGSDYLDKLELAMGEEYMENAVAAGVIGKDGDEYVLLEGTYTEGVGASEDLQNQLSNLMVFGVADEMKNATEVDMAALMVSGLPTEEEDAVQPEGDYSVAATMAAQYAFYKAYALDNPEAMDSFNAMNEAMETATSKDAAMNALQTFVQQNEDGLKEYTEDEAKMQQNAQSISQIMKGVDETSSKYNNADALSNSSLFTSDSVSGDLNMFVGMASVDLGEQRAELQTLLANNPNAVVIVYNNGQVLSTIGE